MKRAASIALLAAGAVMVGGAVVAAGNRLDFGLFRDHQLDNSSNKLFGVK
jgi:hypothetical protein